MINNINKNISVWRGEKTPPTEYHVWIKSNGSVLINKDGTWFTQISESTNDSVNVCNLSNVGYLPTLANAIQTVSAYLGTKVFHVGYKLRYNEAPVRYDPIWKEYILTGSNWYRSDNWKLVFTTDLMNNEEIIKSKHLPSYVDDVLEYSTIDEFPPKGESGKIYLDTSTNKSYRWSGTQYVLIALTDIVTSESDGLMSSEMYQKLEKTATDLDIHDKQNQADFAEIRQSLNKKVGKIVDSQGNIISNDVSIATIPDATSQSAGLMTPDDKIKLDSIESEFVKDLGLVASTDEGDQIAARSEIAGNVKISFIRYRTAGVRAEKVTTIFQWRNGINETAQIKFVDKAQWRRNVTGATGVVGATTTPTMWERTGAHYLGYDAASRTLQLQDYNKIAFRDVQLPLAQNDIDNVVAGLLSPEEKADIGKIITKADFNKQTGELFLKNKTNSQVTSLVIPPATKDGMGLMTESDVIEMGTLTEHRIDRNNPHNVTKAQVGLGNVTNDAQVKRSEMGQPDGVALLNSDGKIPSSYLPSYVSDIITADSYAKLPTTGEEDKIYVTKDTNLTYRWSGTNYVEISPSLALGETSTTAYAGDKGASLAEGVQNLENRVGHGYIDTETSGFAYIGTGSSRVRIIPGADIFASVVGRGTSFTISSNTDTASIGYGASIGQNSVLGAGFSASINNVKGPNGSTRQGIVLKDVNDDNGIKILGRNNGEFLVGTSVYDNNWIDLARLGKISTMIESTTDGLVFYPNRLVGNSKDTSIILGTHTTIGENVHISSNVEIGGGISLRDDSKAGLPIQIQTTVSGSTVQMGNNFKAYPGATLGTGANIGADANIGVNVSMGYSASIGDQVDISDHVVVGTSVVAATSGDSVEIGNDITIATGISITKNASATTIQNNNESSSKGGKLTFGTGNIIWDGVEIGTGVHITEDLTFDSTSYKLGGTNQTTIGKNLNISGNVDQVDVLLKPLEGEAGKIKIQDTIGNANWLTLENKNNILGGDFYGGSMSTIWSGVEIGTGVEITEDLTADSTSYKLGETNQAIIGKNVRLLASLNTAYDYYTLDDPGMSISTISEGIAVTASLGITQQTSSGVNCYSLKAPAPNTMSTALIGENVELTASLSTIQVSSDTTAGYALKDPSGVTSPSTIGGDVKLLASLETVANGGYTFSDPSMRVSTIGDSVLLGSDTTIYGGVEIGSGIQIRDTSTGGLQIYSPSQDKWITIS